jgi:uncharacterized membrane protein YczE
MICWFLFSWPGLELHLASMVLLDVFSDVLLMLWKNSDVLCVAWVLCARTVVFLSLPSAG